MMHLLNQLISNFFGQNFFTNNIQEVLGRVKSKTVFVKTPQRSHVQIGKDDHQRAPDPENVLWTDEKCFSFDGRDYVF